MKKLNVLLFFLAAFIANVAFAQTNISCYHRDVCLWNDDSKDFDDCEGYDENSLFVINAAETMFEHTTPTMSSAYFIKEKVQDPETGVWMLSVTSDVGNEYLYFLDFEADEIRIAAETSGEMVMIMFKIKKTWSKE